MARTKNGSAPSPDGKAADKKPNAPKTAKPPKATTASKPAAAEQSTVVIPADPAIVGGENEATAPAAPAVAAPEAPVATVPTAPVEAPQLTEEATEAEAADVSPFEVPNPESFPVRLRLENVWRGKIRAASVSLLPGQAEVVELDEHKFGRFAHTLKQLAQLNGWSKGDGLLIAEESGDA